MTHREGVWAMIATCLFVVVLGFATTAMSSTVNSNPRYTMTNVHKVKGVKVAGNIDSAEEFTYQLRDGVQLDCLIVYGYVDGGGPPAMHCSEDS